MSYSTLPPAMPGFDTIPEPTRSELIKAHNEMVKKAKEPTPDRFGFDVAIRLLKAGRRVCRTGWNGKGMWLAMTPGHTIPPCDVAVPDGMSTALIPGPTLHGAARAYAIAECPNGITIGAHIDMRAADGSLVIGWLASQTDMLAEDWMVLP